MRRLFVISLFLITYGTTSAQVVDTISYSLGMSTGAKMKTEGLTEIDFLSFVQGLRDQLMGSTIITKEVSNEINYNYITEKKKKVSNVEKQEGEKFLAKNAERPEVITTESGLQYEIIKQGAGENPTAQSEVTVHYVGQLLNGEMFDSSVDRGKPATFPLNRVIKGWTEGVQLMNVGSKYRFYIPFNLAYGASGAGGVIPPYATLIFDIELLSFK